MNLIHPDDRERILPLTQSAISAGMDYEQEFRAVAADGRTVWLRNIVKINRDSEGRAQQLRGVMVDISERKQAESTLRESEERHRKLLENFIDGVLLTVEGKIACVDPVMCELTGYSSEELRGRPSTELLPPEERDWARDRMSALLAGSAERPVVYHYQRKQGELVPVEVGSRLIYYGGKPALLSVVHDISERDRAEQELRPNQFVQQRLADMPMTDRVREAFASQMKQSGDSDYLFPSPKINSSKPHITTVRKLWNRTLQRAGLPHFSLYELRHTFATRLSAGGVADHFVTQMLRQGDSQVFKRYSQAKLNMMREALSKLDRQANERGATFFTALAS